MLARARSHAMGKQSDLPSPRPFSTSLSPQAIELSVTVDDSDLIGMVSILVQTDSSGDDGRLYIRARRNNK